MTNVANVASVTVETTTGRVKVPVIYRRGVWAVTPLIVDSKPSDTQFVVTHIPTGRAGMRNTDACDSDGAINLVRAYADVDENWKANSKRRASPKLDATSLALAAAYQAWRCAREASR